jgi:DNA ligase-associated metallophosphoesterase
MSGAQELEVCGQVWLLLPEKAIFWQEAGALILADLHAGKAQHFRKQGIAVPSQAGEEDLQRLAGLIRRHAPRSLLLLGDLTHSRYNRAWELLAQQLADFSGEKILVRGNHDLLPLSLYEGCGLQVIPKALDWGPFRFTHEPSPAEAGGPYQVGGHVHPGIRLEGRGRQSLRLPCFLFGEQAALLPAFGSFTGLHVLERLPGQRCYAIAGGEVIPLPAA